MKIAIIVGTRPEIIKMSPIIRECENKENLDYFIIHTGQHYSYNMDRVFFEQLNLPKPKYNLNIGSGTHGKQTGKILISIEKVLYEERPDIVLVEGDTNTVLAGALAACKLNIKVGHVEAGLRSYDRAMPEEINRVLVDHCSDFLFTPTKKSKQLLLNEGIDKEKIFVTGNTIVDAVNYNIKLAKKKNENFKKMGLNKKDYFLLTVHRQENVDFENRFKGIIKGVKDIINKYSIPVVYPIHPRSSKMLEKYKINTNSIYIIQPEDYLNFLMLEKNARLVLTDSGGIQEEACILGVPCVTLRDNTERPETLEIGSNILAGAESDKIKDSVSTMINNKEKWNNPFGNGKSAKKILDILINYFSD